MLNISMTPLKHFLCDSIKLKYAKAGNVTIGCGITCGLVAIDMAFQAIKQTIELVQIREWMDVNPFSNRAKVHGSASAPQDAAGDVGADADSDDDFSDDGISHHLAPIKLSIPISRVMVLAGNIQGALFYGACAANILPGAAIFGAGLFIIHSQKIYTLTLPNEHIDHHNETSLKKFFFLQFEALHAIHEYITQPKDYNLLVIVLTHAGIPALRKITDIFKAVYHYTIQKTTTEITLAITYVTTNKRKIALYCGLTIATAFCVSRLLIPKYFAVKP